MLDFATSPKLDEFRTRDDFPAANADSISLNATLPTYTADQVADYLTTGFWGDGDNPIPAGYLPMSFDIVPGGSLAVDITGLTAGGKFFARAALDAWSFVSGINFYEVSSGAKITFDDNEPGAFAGFDSIEWGGTITTSIVNVSTNWIAGDLGNLNSYSFQTYMHEIGHALGLGHAGNYNGSGNYQDDGSGDNHFANDSWQMTLMSYFSQFDNTEVDASFAYVATPMMADIIAIQNLYGTVGDIRDGDTIYGENSDAGGYYDTLDLTNMTFTIIDDGGEDWIRFKTETADMKVDLAPGAISDIGGLVGNMIIDRNTVIENFFAGSGNDEIDGNDVGNIIRGGAGNDLIKGHGGNDVLKGHGGNDVLKGNDGNDVINGNGKHDRILGGAGDDILRGGAGRDVIWGGSGDDRIIGGIGRDKLIGGSGNDTFVFRDGFNKDKIRDFQDNLDTIELDDALWGGGLTIAQVLSAYGSYDAVKGHVVLDFLDKDILIIDGITDVNALLDDILIV